MKCIIMFSMVLMSSITIQAQTNPIISNWLQNTTQMGMYYMKGNSTAISNNILANVQKVQFSNSSVYISTNGIPAYPTGPFQDGNPSVAQSQNGIFKFPLIPQKILVHLQLQMEEILGFLLMELHFLTTVMQFHGIMLKVGCVVVHYKEWVIEYGIEMQ